MKVCSDFIFLTLWGHEVNKFKYIPYIRKAMLKFVNQICFFKKSNCFFDSGWATCITFNVIII